MESVEQIVGYDRDGGLIFRCDGQPGCGRRATEMRYADIGGGRIVILHLCAECALVWDGDEDAPRWCFHVYDPISPEDGGYYDIQIGPFIVALSDVGERREITVVWAESYEDILEHQTAAPLGDAAGEALDLLRGLLATWSAALPGEMPPFPRWPQTAMDDVHPMGIPCEVYSRVVGYLRPVQNWNDGKRQEFSERRAFDPGVSDGAS